MKDQRIKRALQNARVAGEKDQRRLVAKGQLLQFQKLVLFQAGFAEVAADHLEQIQRHQLLQRPEDLLGVFGLRDPKELREIDFTVAQAPGSQIRVALVDPGDPLTGVRYARGGLHP